MWIKKRTMQMRIDDAIEAAGNRAQKEKTPQPKKARLKIESLEHRVFYVCPECGNLIREKERAFESQSSVKQWLAPCCPKCGAEFKHTPATKVIRGYHVYYTVPRQAWWKVASRIKPATILKFERKRLKSTEKEERQEEERKALHERLNNLFEETPWRL